MEIKNNLGAYSIILIVFFITNLFFTSLVLADGKKCGDAYPAGKGSGACYSADECKPKKDWNNNAPVQIVGGQELCEVNGERCCVYSGELQTGGPSADALQAQAAGAFNRLGGISGNTTGAATLIGRVVQLLTAFMGSIALVLYIYAGIIWMTASGAKERVAQAQKIIVWTTFGIIVMLGSYILASFLFKMF